MSLATLIVSCSQKLGVDRNNTSGRQWLIDEINRACQEFYNSMSDTNLLREIVAIYDGEKDQATFGPDVGTIQGIRKWNYSKPVNIQDQRPRYVRTLWPDVDMFNWRVKYQGPLCRSFTNTAPVTFSLPKVETEDIILTVAGQTELSAHIVETLTIPAGSLSVTSNEQFSPLGCEMDAIKSIEKNRLTRYDIAMTDSNDNLMSLIPANQLSPLYWIINIYEGFFGIQDPDTSIEVLYKQRYVPLYYPSDRFCQDLYDTAILWKVMANNGKTIDDALATNAKADLLKMQAADNTMGGDNNQLALGQPRVQGGLSSIWVPNQPYMSPYWSRNSGTY